MKMQQIAMGLGLVLIGCTASQPRPAVSVRAAVPREPIPSQSSTGVSVDAPAAYTYELLTPEQTRLLQVFDDTRRTYLTFRDQVPLGLLIFDDSGRPVPFTLGERTAIVEGVRAGLLLRTPTKLSYAQAPKRAVRARIQPVEGGGEEGAPWLPAELAAARADILRAQARLTEVSAQLDQAARGEPSRPLSQLRSEIEEIQTDINGVTETLVRAHFASGSALLALSTDTTTAILAAASRADRISIRGGTDNSGSVAVNDVLARERAESMRRLLIEGGIAADKVRTSSSKAEYIATNSTVAGRAQNRRVDLVFAHRAQDRVPVARNEFKAEAER